MGRVAPEVVEQIRSFLREAGIEKAILFGSLPRGTSKEWSDIDLT